MTVAINEIVKNALVFNLKNWEKKRLNTNDLLDVVESLFSTLEKCEVNYLLVGGVALLSYIEGRNTQDIDLILSRQDLQVLPELQILDENNDFIRGNFKDLQIDILLTQNNLFKTVLLQFLTERKFGERVIRCVTVEGLILLKLYALPSLYRQGKFDRVSIYENDILLLMLNYNVDTESILTLLKKHILKSDLEEVQEVLVDIQGRIKRFYRQQKNIDNKQ
jgi:hypothetical protein